MAGKGPIAVRMVGGKVVAEKKASAVVIDDDTAKTKAKVSALVPVLTAQFASLVGVGTIEDDEQYAQADKMLGQVVTARKSWSTRMEDIVRPISDGLQRLYKLNREVNKPLEELENKIKRAMGEYKLAEARRIREENDAKEHERQQLEARKAVLKTPAAIERVQAQIEEVEAFEPVRVMGQHSAARPVQRVRVLDVQALCAAIGSGLVPVDCVEIRQPRLNAYLKDDADSVKEWPGIEVYDDVDIAAR